MICKKCGKEIDDSAKFCEYCGTALNVKSENAGVQPQQQSVVDLQKNDVVKNSERNTSEIPTQNMVQNQPRSSSKIPIPDPVSAGTAPAKKKSSKKLIIAVTISIVMIIAVIAAIVIIGAAIIIISDKKSHEDGDKKIDDVKGSYFEFLPEMTVGDIITEYYGEDYWACDSDGIVEFWGTNQKDKSGLALHFEFTETAGIVDVTYIKYHEENETAHDISKKEFETYILGLYDQLDGEDEKSAQTTTVTTVKAATTKKTSATTEAAKTTAAKKNNKQEKPEESKYYLAYLVILNEMDSIAEREYGDTNFPYYRYYLYDINKDGFCELILHVGESEADSMLAFYTIDEDSEEGFIELGEIAGGHTWLTEKDGKLYSNYGHSGYQLVHEIKMSGHSVTQTPVFEEEDLSEYVEYGTSINGYDLSDTSAVEALCPKDILDDKPHVEAYAKTSDFSGRDGYESRLYLEGDFAYVSVESSYERYGDYDSDFAEYSYDETRDGIVVYQGSDMVVPTLYITPYSEFGVAGDMITCDIPTETSGTVQTGGMSYPVDNMKGQINCQGGTVAGFTTDYVVNGGAVGKVRDSLGDAWHVTAKNACYNYGVTWYELWDSDDGDYYGWVDENYIDFY